MVDDPKLPTTDPDAPEDLEREASTYLFGRERWQNYLLKWAFPTVSMVTVILTLFYLWLFADHLLEMKMCDIMKAPPIFLVSLVVTPILSLTTIIVFALIGVFRGYRDKDLAEVPLSTMARAATGQDV